MITVVKNRAATIVQCLESVSAQEHEAQHIIVDGASDDGTLDLIRQSKRQGAVVLSEPDNGMYDALNKGLALADRDIVGILHADDFYPNRYVLSKVAEVMTDPNISACYGDLVYVDPFNSKKIVRMWKSCKYDPKLFLKGWMPPHPTFFARKGVYEKLGGFNPELGTAADYELMLRFLYKHGTPAAYIPEILVVMRTGGASNASIRNRLWANLMDRKAWRINGLKPYPWTLVLKPIRKIGQFVSVRFMGTKFKDLEKLIVSEP